MMVKLAATDFASLKIGQEFNGKLVSALPFGVFVDIDQGTNVLLPRSALSKGNYEKFKSMVDAKDAEKIKIQVGVTLSISVNLLTHRSLYISLPLS